MAAQEIVYLQVAGSSPVSIAFNYLEGVASGGGPETGLENQVRAEKYSGVRFLLLPL